VFTDIDAIFHYSYEINFTDSGLAKTKMFPDTLARRRQIITLNYNDYQAPSPDTSSLALVNVAPEPKLSLDVIASQSIARIDYSLPSDGSARLFIQDVLGRTVRTISDGFRTQGEYETGVALDGLLAGTYYVTLESGQGNLTRKFALVR
jgi:hypothetical protein